MGPPGGTEGSHGAGEEGPHDGGRRSDGGGVVVDRVCGFRGDLRREAAGGGVEAWGQPITKEITFDLRSMTFDLKTGLFKSSPGGTVSYMFYIFSCHKN